MLRIGVNLGNVMVEGSDLYGDGVNIAARLESLADPNRTSNIARLTLDKQISPQFVDMAAFPDVVYCHHPADRPRSTMVSTTWHIAPTTAVSIKTLANSHRRQLDALTRGRERDAFYKACSISNSATGPTALSIGGRPRGKTNRI